MKSVIISALSVILYVSACAQEPEGAQQILASGVKQAAAQNKNLFVMFHASWCGWCHKMDDAMNDPSVASFFTDNYVIRHLVVLESKDKKKLENPGALELMNKYSEESSGIPFWIIFDKSGTAIADSREKLADGSKGGNVGCPASEKEVAHFINVLRQTSSIKKDGLAIIQSRFRKIETSAGQP
ncbi:MAG: thioredoxin family protein [Chitinophagaceae bacterium]|nr:MAG: thioredoxin family protein [Chitinophagaceae bacterium]